MAAILLAVTGWDPSGWEQRFRMLAPGRDLRIWPDRIGHPDEIAYACLWDAPQGMLREFESLKAIFSLGAGVDHLLDDPTLPALPIVRVVDPDLTMRMTEYVVLHVLAYHRRCALYRAQQGAHRWCDHDQPSARQVAVGIMGLGVLGSAAAVALSRLGFQVAGWCRQPKLLTGIETYSGSHEFDRFLRRTEILVCLLPATPATREILNLANLSKLHRQGPLGGAFLINAGRGSLQINADILAALDQDYIAGATLDVFPTEPLRAADPLWAHPRVTITPHNAAASDPSAIVTNILRQIDRYEAELPLENLIDRSLGY
jgi:glyoxylate/hydroxypyruvate reductase A